LRLIGFISSSDVETPILMSLMRDLLWEMVTEPLFWPVMLVLAGTFAYLGDFLKSALRGTAFGSAFTHLPRCAWPPLAPL
jgi:hypothetical protein